MSRNRAWTLGIGYSTLPEYDPNYSSQNDDPIMDKYIDLLKIN
jgi:hypothetical protein